jgi:TupA-like ATPgrasp
VLRFLSRTLVQVSPWLGGWLTPFVQIMREYQRAHGRFPNIVSPKRFTEKIQWRKLFDLNPLYAVLSDKIAVREFVRSKVGTEYLIPLLWEGHDADSIPFDRLVPPYVIKSSHGCGHVLFVNQTTTEPQVIREIAHSWLNYRHGSLNNEPGYVNVPPRLLIERLLFLRDGSIPRERKFFVFGGRAKFIESLAIDPRDRGRFSSYHTVTWEPLPWRFHNPSRALGASRPFDGDDRYRGKVGRGFRSCPR